MVLSAGVLAAIGVAFPAGAAAAAPVCDSTQQTLRTGKPIELRAYCFDPDGDAVEVTVTDGPDHGALDGDVASGEAIFTPSGTYTGPDAFTFAASDGSLSSAPASFDLSITPNHAPECDVTTARHTRVSTAVSVFALCEDQDAQDRQLAYTAVPGAGPAHGTLGGFGSGSQADYSPDAGFSGEDAFTIRASDGSSSDELVQGLHIANTPLCSTPPPVDVAPGSERFLIVDCTAPSDDFGALDYEIGAAPSKGALSPSGSSPSPGRSYTASSGAQGADSYTVRLTGSSGSSPYVRQEITTGAVTPAPATTGSDPVSDSGPDPTPSPEPPPGSAFSPGLPRIFVTADTRPPAAVLTARRQRLGSVAGRGFTLGASCDEPCSIELQLVIDRATARRLGLGRRALVVGTLTRRFGVRSTAVNVRLNVKSRRAFRAARSVRLTARAVGTDAAGNVAAAVTRSVSLRR